MQYGIKAILRFPFRSFLFFLLIGAASLFLSLGMSVWFSAQDMLAEADSSCVTAGEIVFQGGGYPDAGTFDPTLAEADTSLDFKALGALPGVLLAEENYEHRAYIKNETLQNNITPYTGYVLLEVDVIAPLPNKDYFISHVREVYYSADAAPVGVVYIVPDEQNPFEYQTGHTYLVSGNISMIGGIANVGLQPVSYTPVVAAAGGPATAYPPILDITDYTEQDKLSFWESETGLYFLELSKMIQTVQNSAPLTASAAIESVEQFHKGEYTLLEGRLFTEQDYESGEVCLVPARMAETLGLSVGGTLDLGIHRSVDGAGVYASYWPEVGFAHEGSYLVAGIYQTTDRNTPIYIPDAGQTWLGHSGNDYTLGRVVVQNNMSGAFDTAVKSLLPVGVTLQLYDQGYGHIARSLAGMKETAQVIIFVSGAVCLVILLFFGFLFVSRQAVSASILVALGTSPGRIRLFFLSGAGLLTALAAIVGGSAAYFGADSLTYQIWMVSQSPDRRFSLGGSGLQLAASKPEITLFPFLLTAALVIGSALLICAVCLRLVLRSLNARFRMRKTQKKQQQKARKSTLPSRAFGATVSAVLPGHALRYGVRTMLRGHRRALLTVLVFAVLFCAVGVMSTLRMGYENSLISAYQEIPVTVHFTDAKGKMTDGLSVLSPYFETLSSYDFVEESWSSYNTVYNYVGKPQGNAEEADWVTIPDQGTFAYETFSNQLLKRFSPFVMSDTPAYTKNHFYSSPPEIQWAPGHDLKTYQESAKWTLVGTPSRRSNYYSLVGTPSLLVSQAFLQTRDLALGDTINLQFFIKDPYGAIFDYRLTAPIAGVYSGGLQPETVYISSELILPGQNLHAGGIRLKSAEMLDEIREVMSGSFSEPFQLTGNRVWIYIDDTELTKTVEILERYVGYLNYLQPVMLAVAIGLGFLTANLALRARRREIALLRSVGTGRMAVFFSLYWEQMLLCVPGILLGFFGIAAITGRWNFSISIGLGILTLCFLVGAAAAIIQTQRVSLISNLLERE